MTAKNRNVVNVLLYAMIALYLFMLLDLLFRYNIVFDAHRDIRRSLNLIPLRTIRAYASGGTHLRASFTVSNLLGNIAVFIPFGLFLQTLRRRKTFWRGVLIVAVASVAVEVLQYAFGLGASDVDDVILNTCGGAVGLSLYTLLRKAFRDEARTRRAIAILSLVIGLPIACFYFSTVFAHLRL